MRLEFAWPLPAEAVVEEWVEKEGSTVKMRYFVSIEPEGELLLVDHRDIRITEVDGRPIETIANRAEIETLIEQATASMPTIVANARGEFVGLSGFDEMLDIVSELEGESADREVIDQAMRSPQMIAQLEQAVGEIWRGWAEAWSGLELRPGEPLVQEFASVVATYQIVDLDAETVSVELRIVHDPEALLQQVKASLRNMSAQLGRDPAEVDEQLAGAKAERVALLTATLRRDNSLPLAASREISTRMEFPGEQPKVQREVHRYTFEWQAPAEG